MYPYYNYEQKQDDRIWVQNKNAAEAYLVAPNSFVRLWSSTEPMFYEKRADQNGRPYMESYKYEKVHDVPEVAYDKQISILADRICKLEETINGKLQ